MQIKKKKTIEKTVKGAGENGNMTYRRLKDTLKDEPNLEPYSDCVDASLR
jgi:hypothetical protein